MKKILSVFFALLIIVTAFPKVTASAYYKSGTVGNIEYTISGSHLIISGNGGMGYTARWPWGRDIKELTILEGVTSISRTAFSECKFLSFVELPNSLKIIENNAFYGCENLGFVDIPSSVSKIGSSAFGDCYSLTRIVLPRDLTELGAGMLDGCTSLERIEVDEGNKKFCSVDGVLFSADKTTLIQYPMGRYESAYAVPDEVKTISENAFSGNTSLSHIRIGQNVTKIGKNAFNGTPLYESFNAYESGLLVAGYCVLSASGNIGTFDSSIYTVIADGAFEGCSGLHSVELTENIKRIGENTFKNCEDLSRLSLSTAVKTIEANAFSGCDSLEAVYYAGSASQAQKIKMAAGNSPLSSAKWYYNACRFSTEHILVNDSETEATCSRKGKIVEKCLMCGYTKTQTSPSTSHTYGNFVTVKAATCTDAGLKEKECVYCTKVIREAIAPLGHDFEKTTGVGRVSCKTADSNKCKRCSASPKGNEALISHKYGAWKETKAPTCTLEGQKEQTCSDCSKKQTRAISPLGHLFDDTAVKKEATLYSEGLVEGKCKRCKQTVKEKLLCTYNNEKLGIKIEAAEGVFKKGTEISVIRVEDNSPLIPRIDGLPKNFAAYSISAKNGNKTAVPNGKFKVTINIPEDFSGDVDIFALGLSDATEVKSTLSADNKTITAEISKFGNYAVCDFSQGLAVSSAKDEEIPALEFNFSLILKLCLMALASLALAVVVILLILLIVKKIRKNRAEQ